MVFSRFIASTAAAAAVALLSFTDSANAVVVVPGSSLGHLGARHLAVTPVHHTFNRKRNAHKLRKRCVQPGTDSGSNNSGSNNSGSNNSGSNNSGSNNSGSNNSGSNNSGSPNYNYGGRGKAGLAWPNGPWTNMSPFATNKVGYYYTWNPECLDPAITNGVKCAPMLWGWKQQAEFDGRYEEYRSLIARGAADVILGFNEVNQHDQANMNIWEGKDLWERSIARMRGLGYRLGSPATTSHPNGLDWIIDWLKIVDTKPDFIAVHWYDVGAQKFKDYVTNFRNKIQQNTGVWYNFWVTEFACQNFNGGAQCSYQEVVDFMNDVTAWMDGEGWIEAYFWFGAMREMQGVNDYNRLLNWDGSPTDLGYNFIY